jgi:hypothetical protein
MGDSAYFFSADRISAFDDSMSVQICVTLNEWEHICERFEGATHYTEKALYKLLSQHIVPAIVTELRVSMFFAHLKTEFDQNKAGDTTETSVGRSYLTTQTLFASRY